jgi:hypothetical protein
MGVVYKKKCKNPLLLSLSQPQISQDYPVNLSILITGGKETNKDVCSIGE